MLMPDAAMSARRSVVHVEARGIRPRRRAPLGQRTVLVQTTIAKSKTAFADLGVGWEITPANVFANLEAGRVRADTRCRHVNLTVMRFKPETSGVGNVAIAVIDDSTLSRNAAERAARLGTLCSYPGPAGGRS
jgi:hypothetical protein